MRTNMMRVWIMKFLNIAMNILKMKNTLESYLIYLKQVKKNGSNLKLS